MADDRASAFEERLAALKQKMERGLVDRARSFREVADRLDQGDETAREVLKREAHRLRGVAGSHGHEELGERAREIEQRASVSAPPVLAALARELATLAERASAEGVPASHLPSVPPPRPEGMSAREQMVSERPPIAPGPLRVLGIDDDPITQRLLQLTFDEVGGFSATIVGSAAEALARLRFESYDLVVSDAMMPDMSGWDFCDAARAAGARMPIVILSAATAEELGWQPRTDGPVAWMRKPFRPTTFVHELVCIVREHRGG
jgi:CheY-like chemotaxis protein/HPt (histidine-containing phosphotransfer) domain-containing protein